MFIQIFISIDTYVLVNLNHIVSIDFLGSGSIITLSTKETIESTDNPNTILEQLKMIQSL